MKRLVVVLAVTAAGAVGGCGSDDPPAGPAATPTTIEVTMRDIAFAPETVSVPAGEPVTFVFHNVGKLRHEAVLGDEAFQDQHEQEMSDDVDLGSGHHGGHDSVTVEPGETGRLTHTFGADDRLLIGCHEPGHYSAGMRVTINVKD